MPIDPAQALAEQQAALRGLARRLASSEAGADDLLQEAAVRALERPAPRSLRGWLARVMTNLARDGRRQAARRDRRERAAAASEPTPAAGDLVERHDIRLRLMEAVGALDEPYRQTVLLRFFEGLPPRKIAARLGVPVKTVDSRLQRALARLRAELDRTHGGDRRVWMAALVPLFEPTGVAAATVGIALMNAKLIGAAAAAVLVAAVWWTWGDADDAGAAAATSRDREVARAPAGDAAPAGPGEEERRLEAPEVAAPPADAPAPDAVDPIALGGRVVGVDGTPRAGVKLAVTWDDLPTPDPDDHVAELVSDARGRFTWDVVPGSEALLRQVRVTSIDPRYVAILDAQLDASSPDAEPPVVVCDATVVSGVVLAPDRTPLEGARLDLALPENFRAQLPFDLSGTESQRFSRSTDAQGRFSFEAAPALDGMSLRVMQVGFVTADRAVDSLPAPHLEIVLERPGEMAVLEGVVYADAGPVRDARVALGNLPATTDADGAFRIEYDAAAPPDRLMAVARGRRAAFVDRNEGESWPPYLEVVLDGEPPSIAGVVLDVDGTPVPNAKVWLAEPTVFGSFEESFWVAELVITGDSGLQRDTATDANGRFRLEGLVDRTYGLKAMDPNLAWKIDAGEAVAGDQDVVIRFPAGGLHRRLSGRVVDSAGAPVEGARVQVMTLMLAARDPVSQQAFYNVESGASSTSDADGRFTLEDVPKDSQLEVTGKGLLSAEHEIPASVSAPVVLRVARVCEFRVERAGAAAAVECELRDAAGAVVPAVRREVGLIQTLLRIPLEAGQSEVLTAPDTARRAVLFDADGAEVDAFDLRLVPGERTIVR